MASIIKKKNKYSTYYVVAESKRVGGKPRIVKQWYLGTIEKIIQMAERRPDREMPRQISCEEEGCVAVLFKIAEELGVRRIVNEHVQKRCQGMTVGEYVLLASLNRAIAATSKVKIREWVDQTTLHLYMPFDRKKLDSQNFWDHFDKIDEAAVEEIGDELARAAVKLENISLDCLIYDTSNYFNCWDVLNPSKLACLTKSKAGRSSLRHIGLALAVDRDWGLPLFHRLYPANNHDSKIFKQLIDAMFKQISDTVNDKHGVTFVFDKGNNSEQVIAKLDDSRHHFVGTRSAYHHKDLCKIPLENYSDHAICLDEDDSILPVHETRLELYGQSRRVLVVYNEATHHRQLHRLNRNLDRAKEELSYFKKRAKDADGRSTLDSIHKHGGEILSRFHVSGYLDIEVNEDKDAGGFRVCARKNHSAIEEAKTRFGKQILFTNRETLSVAQIIKIYLDRYIVEEAFRITKSDLWVKMDPAFHWTDTKIRVHSLTCIIALLLVRIAHKRARQKGFTNGAERMMELLRGVKSAMLYYPKSSKPVRQLCSITEEQRVLLTQLESSLANSM